MTTKTQQHGPLGNSEVVACGCSGNPQFDGLDPAYKRILWVVIIINAAMFSSGDVRRQACRFPSPAS